MIGPTNAMTVTGTVDPSGVTVGSDTKPVKIVNGVATMVANDLVSTTGDQTISGTKTFTRSTAHSFILIANSTFEDNSGSYPPDTRYTGVAIHDNNGHTLSQLNSYFDSSGNSGTQLRCMKQGNAEIYLDLMNTASNTRYARLINQRSYSASNTSDIVTIGTLQQSTDVVHTVGAETINGEKTITNQMIVQGNVNNYRYVIGTTSGDAGWRPIYKINKASEISFTGIYRVSTGTRRNGGTIIFNLDLFTTSENTVFKKTEISGTSTKRMAITKNDADSYYRVWAYIPQSTTAIIEIIGTPIGTMETLPIESAVATLPTSDWSLEMS